MELFLIKMGNVRLERTDEKRTRAVGGEIRKVITRVFAPELVSTLPHHVSCNPAVRNC